MSVLDTEGDRTMSDELRLGRVVIADGRPVVTIAEAACEHLGSLEVAKRMVEAAKGAGADIIKFQLHLTDEMIPGSIQFWGGSMDDVLARYNLSVDDHRELIHYCDKVGIQYLCTPFCARAADLLNELGVAAFKTGSGELTNLPMLRHIARLGKPMIVSTGMATFEEIGAAVDALNEMQAHFILTHCTSAYPPRYEEINLRVITRLRERFGILVGHSDHTPDIWTALAAAVIGACVIEKHFTLDRSLRGPDYSVSLEPQEFAEMVGALRKIEAALGAEKRIHANEQPVRKWAHHSVVSVCDIPAGAVLTPHMLGVKRPGRGVPARYLEDFYGRVAARAIRPNTLISWPDVGLEQAPSQAMPQREHR
jgi:sialic acid synthase SpsE